MFQPGRQSARLIRFLFSFTGFEIIGCSEILVKFRLLRSWILSHAIIIKSPAVCDATLCRVYIYIEQAKNMPDHDGNLTHDPRNASAH